MVRATWDVSFFFLPQVACVVVVAITILIVYTLERCNIVYNVERYKVDDDHSKMRIRTRGIVLSDGCIRENKCL